MDEPQKIPSKMAAYYARNCVLPSSHECEAFLKLMPPQGHILDVGAGNGRWAFAFKRDRPDLTIDLLDRYIDQAVTLPPSWQGNKIASNFQSFTPTKSYDGIWASSSLFFLTHDELTLFFHTLATILNPQGTFFFTMADDCEAATKFGLKGMNKETFTSIIENENLTITSLALLEHAKYGAEKIAIPTYDVFVQKQ